MSEKKLSGFFQRLSRLMAHHDVSSVNELATKHLQYDSPEKINRLKKEGRSPSAEIIADIITLWPETNANWLITGNGEMVAGVSNKIETIEHKEPSMASVLLVLAEGYKAQVETIKNMEKNMAQQETLKDATANVKRVFAGLQALAKGETPAMKMLLDALEELKVQRKVRVKD
jgi:hypothetical protein